jgi:RNA 2',3'-cyclic 3'-phosphodiesterase
MTAMDPTGSGKPSEHGKRDNPSVTPSRDDVPGLKRLFAAIEVPEGERARIGKWLAGAGLDRDDLRLVAPEHWHITLAFFGDVPDGKIADLTTRLGRASARTPAFGIRLAGIGTFPTNATRARVLWLGVAGDTVTLEPLAERCRAAGRRLGLPMPEERFRPHLTIARARRGSVDLGASLTAVAGYDGPAWPVTSARLVRSTLGPTVRHDQVTEFRLEGGR